jgi:biopolymer transport protein ExbD
MKRHHRGMEVMSDLNLTNLLDTAFVLLIAFMLVSPTVQQGLELELPKVTAAKALDAEKNKTLVIAIQKAAIANVSDPVLIDNLRVSMEELSAELLSRKASDPELGVIIQSDKAVRWDTVAQVFSTVKANGITKIGVVTEPATKKPEEPDDKKSKKP